MADFSDQGVRQALIVGIGCGAQTCRVKTCAPLFGPLCAAALLAGVGGCLLLPGLPSEGCLLACLCLGLALLCCRFRPVGMLLCGLAYAGLQAGAVLQAQLPPTLQGQQQIVQGRVADLPVQETRRTRFEFLVDDSDAVPLALRGKTLRLSWYAKRHQPPPHLQAGSRWRLLVKLRAPRGLRNPAGGDAEKYALATRIAAVGHVTQPALAIRLAPGDGMAAWRERSSQAIADAVQSPASRFVQALALGDTRALTAGDWERLRASGLTHLIAISGFHVGLVAGFGACLAAAFGWLLPGCCRHFPRPFLAGAGAIIAAFAYAAMTGWGLPTLRTVVMITALVAARCLRRRQRLSDSLALACGVLLLLDPLAVLGAGFWLSFAGVAWLLWYQPESRHAGLRGMLRGFVAAQAVATLGLLPLTVVLFGQASLVGPFANLLAVPWWSLVVVPLSLLGILGDSLHAGLGQYCWQAAGWCFELLWPLLEWMADSRVALFWLPQADWYALPLALLAAFWGLLPRGMPGRWPAQLLWLPLLAPPLGLPAPGALQLTVIDVGQGLAVLVRTHGHALLYDMGPALPEGYDAGERAVLPTLHALGVRHLDAAVISHGDMDHAGGWPAVRAEFPTTRVLAPAGSPVPGTGFCRRGQRWQWDGVRFRILHPTRGFPYLGNEASCVLRIETRHGNVLLAGDIGQYVERKLLSEHPDWLRNRVVLVAHHGSNGSSDPGFVAATHARLALLSTGADNRFRHPRPEVVHRWCRAGAEVLDTSRSGAIRVWIDAAGLAVREQRSFAARAWDAVRRRGQVSGLCYAPELERP